MRQVLVILLWLILLSSSVLDDKSHAEDLSASMVKDLVFDPNLSYVLQKALEEAARVQGADSISASLYFSDQCHWEGTTGVTEQDPNIPVESDMLYGFGSIIKTFVAAIVLQLVEENRLGLEDRLEKWLDKYPNIDTNITVHQLLNHTSGLGGYLRNKHFRSEFKANLDRVWSPEEMLKYVASPSAQGLSRCPRFRWHRVICHGIIRWHGPEIRLPFRFPASVSRRSELRALSV